MSAFYRFIFSTFLLLALICFSASSAFAQTFKYYKVNATNTCVTSYSTVCSQHLSYLGSLYPKTSYHLEGCNLSGNSVDITYSKTVLEMKVVPPDTQPTEVPVNYSSDGQYRIVGNQMSLTCPEGATLKLTGCTAECIVDPCKALEGIEQTATVTCGVASCPSPETFNYDGSTVGCSNGAKTQFLPQPAQATVIDNCSHSIKPGQLLPTTAKAKTSASGSTTQAYCSATFVNDGVTSNTQQDLSNLASLSFGGVTPTTENGQCPDGTVKGQVNGQWVCVDDSNKGEGSGCSTGQIKNNQGECVPFSEAGTGSGSGSGDGSGSGSGSGSGDGSGSGSGSGSGTGSGSGSGSGSGGGSGGGGAGACNPQTGVGCAPEGTENAGAGGTYNGSVGCETAPDCSGDVVQCGLIHQQWQSGCDLQKAMTGVPEGAGGQYSEVGTNTNDSRVTSAVGSLTNYTNDIKAFLIPPSSGSCPADFSVSVMSHSIVVPLSKACPLFQFMRFLLHLIVNLMCLRILYSSFVRV